MKQEFDQFRADPQERESALPASKRGALAFLSDLFLSSTFALSPFIGRFAALAGIATDLLISWLARKTDANTKAQTYKQTICGSREGRGKY